MSNAYYYHAGTELDGRVIWSAFTRLTYESARSEAIDLATENGGRGIVECWRREHGMHPCSADAAECASYVD